MADRAWVISCESGEWDDHCDEPVCVALSGEEAAAAAERVARDRAARFARDGNLHARRTREGDDRHGEGWWVVLEPPDAPARASDCTVTIYPLPLWPRGSPFFTGIPP